jgi:hypothetical protein
MTPPRGATAGHRMITAYLSQQQNGAWKSDAASFGPNPTKPLDAFYAFYAWRIHFPQSGALAEGASRPTSRKHAVTKHDTGGWPPGAARRGPFKSDGAGHDSQRIEF